MYFLKQIETHTEIPSPLHYMHSHICLHPTHHHKGTREGCREGPAVFILKEINCKVSKSVRLTLCIVLLDHNRELGERGRDRNKWF